jgi:hypothetical protein
VSLLAGLAMTTAVFLLLPEFSERLQGERQPLFVALTWALGLSIAASSAFIGELKARPWRRRAQIALVGVLAGMVWHYWPT